MCWGQDEKKDNVIDGDKQIPRAIYVYHEYNVRIDNGA